MVMASRNAMARTWDVRRREVVLRHVLNEGAAWDIQTSNILMKLSPNKKWQVRLGSRQAKKAEQLQNPGAVLSPSEATSYRQLAARANYLALDRPDIAYATKELGRAFANATSLSVKCLKKLARYLARASVPEACSYV